MDALKAAGGHWATDDGQLDAGGRAEDGEEDGRADGRRMDDRWAEGGWAGGGWTPGGRRMDAGRRITGEGWLAHNRRRTLGEQGATGT